MTASVKLYFIGFSGGLRIFAHSIAGGNGMGRGAPEGSFRREPHQDGKEFALNMFKGASGGLTHKESSHLSHAKLSFIINYED